MTGRAGRRGEFHRHSFTTVLCLQLLRSVESLSGSEQLRANTFKKFTSEEVGAQNQVKASCESLMLTLFGHEHELKQSGIREGGLAGLLGHEHKLKQKGAGFTAMEVTRSRVRAFVTVIVLIVFEVAFLCGAAENAIVMPGNGQPDDLSRSAKHRSGWCSMYGICGKRQDGQSLNCPKYSPATTPNTNFSYKVQSLCPTITGDLCCTEDQFDLLRQSVQQAVPFLVGCPACLRNFLNLYCELSCSPDQSLFIDVTSVNREHDQDLVDGIDFYITDKFGTDLYDSCKDVKFTAMNTRAMDFIGAGAKNYTEWFAFMGRKADLYELGSPYSISYKTSGAEEKNIQPLNASVAPCWDSSLGCSCGDCPDAIACTATLPPPSNTTEGCQVNFGLFKVGCYDLGLFAIYVVSLVAILAWVTGRCQAGNTEGIPEIVEPLVVSRVSDESVIVSGQEGEITPVEVQENGKPEQVPELSPFIEAYLAKWFRIQGIWVARNPGKVLLCSLTITVILCFGLLNLQVETSPQKLWVSSGSKAAEEKEFFDTNLAPFYRIEQLIIGSVAKAGEESAPYIVTNENLFLLFDIQEKVDSIRGSSSGKSISLQDICTKPLGTPCATQSILQYFQMDQGHFYDYGGATHVEFCFEHYSSSAQCLSAFEGPVDPTTILGGFPGTNYTQATAFVISYPVENSVGDSEDANQDAIAWEREFIRLAQGELKQMVEAKGLTLSFTSESSIEAELERESTADILTIALSYLVMFVYISIVLGEYSPSVAPFYVTSKTLLGLAGVIIVALSVLGSVGLFSVFGVKSTLIIAEVIPFLGLAVGVDNMCILVHAVERQNRAVPVEERIGVALSEVGPSITLASLSEVLAFAVGIVTPMPACRVFSMFAALAILLDFVLQVTAFVAFLTYDLKRTEEGRVDCFPWIVAEYDSNRDEGHSNREEGHLVQYMQKFHAPVLSIKAVKAVVLAVFSGLFILSIGLTLRLTPGLDQKVALPRDSYLQGYFDNITEYLRVGPPVYFVVRDYNYSAASNHTNQLCSISHCDPNSLLNEVSQAALTPDTSFIARPAASWLDDFLIFISPDAFGCCRVFPDGSYCPPDDQPPCCAEWDDYCTESEGCPDCTTCFLQSDLLEGRPSTAQFKEKLPWFLSALPSADCAKGGHGAYTNSVNLTGYDSGLIRASEFRSYHTPLNKQTDYIDALRAAKDFTQRMSEKLKMDIFPYSIFYIFFEQYLDIWTTTLGSIALALCAVFFVSLAITSSFWISGIVILVLAMIVVDLMGVMVLWNIQLNAVSVVNLVMSIGIAVEFCVHITHGFLVSTGSRSERASKALSTMGASVFSGITITKFAGVIVLYFSKSEIFEVYYFRMYFALVILGALHGLVFLPVLLSLFGPPSISLSSFAVSESQQVVKGDTKTSEEVTAITEPRTE